MSGAQAFSRSTVEVGDPAPHFTVKDQHNQLVSLADYLAALAQR